jgi:formylglycine-generating enzyme required for sulfatase activity
LNFDHLIVRDVDGERRVDAAHLPLRIGTGNDCSVRLPGPGGSAVLLLDILDGAPFVQPFGSDSPFAINGEPLLSSRRLGDGDEIQFYGSRLTISTRDARLLLVVRLEDSAYVTQAPQFDDEEAMAAEEAIAPTAFKRAAAIGAAEPETVHSPLKAIVIVGLAVLGLASWLLFSARSVQFQVDPVEPDSFSISGGWFRLPLGDRVLLRQGDYTLTVRKDGYYDVEQAFVIGEEATKTVSVSMRKLPGTLTVLTSPPAEVTVSVDETHIGPAPLGPVELQPGEHSISVRSERFLPFDDILSFPGLGREETLNVQLVPRWADVSVTSNPPGAAIFSGDQQVGETPAVVQLLEGTHQLSVVRDGFKAWDGAVVAEPNTPQTLPLIVLDESDARLLVNSIPRGANVMVNGRYRGQSPITLDLAPDIDYQIGLSKAGYGTTTRDVRLRSAASESITVDLTARTGSVTVNVAPADASVYVDGRLQGTGSKTLRLSSAAHRIEVRKAGYESWSKNVTPRPGYPQTLSARLRSNEAIARSKIDQVVETADGKKLRRVEPGTFTMGASRSEQGRRANEVLVPVTLTRPFYISTQEVTNKEFGAFEPSHDSGGATHASLASDTNPVANVTWQQAAEYCNFLSSREGLTPVYEERFGQYEAIRPFPNGYRLPTEAEWVWAVRYGASGSAAKFSWGNQWPPRRDAGNYADRSGGDILTTILPNYDDGYVSTAPVGSFPPNALGIYDGGGNVAEWVNDFYTVPTPGITTPLRDPLGPDRGNDYVIRGSSWKHAGVTELRMSYRDYGQEPRTDLGFRVVRNAE